LTFLEVVADDFYANDLTNRIQKIEETLSILDSFVGKGFVNSINLTLVPLIKDLLPAFIFGGKESNIFINGDKSMDCYK